MKFKFALLLTLTVLLPNYLLSASTICFNNRVKFPFTKDDTIRSSLAHLATSYLCPAEGFEDKAKNSAQLTVESLEQIVEVASEHWVKSGLSEAQLGILASVTYAIEDLCSNHLGMAYGSSITIDHDGAGQGWFIEQAPRLENKFPHCEGVDLLTTILHEQGHVLGLVDESFDSSNLMYQFLKMGERRLPVLGQAASAKAGSIIEPAFLKLNAPLPQNGDVQSARVTADGSRVVWRADGDNDGVFELYSRATDGSSSQVKINDSLPSGGNVLLVGLQITADSSRVVWRGDGNTDGVSELYSRPVDGSGSQVKINGSLPSGGDIDDFLISADSNWVVWRGDGDIDGVSELYSRATNGSSDQVKLNDSLTYGGNVQYDFQISADGSRVVWRADGDTDETFMLYSRATDGSGREARINDPLTSNGDIRNFQVSADGSFVVWRADGDTDGVTELYSRASDGSGSQVRINDPLPYPNGDVVEFKISADGSRVVWRADGNTAEVIELYSRASDGSGSQVRINDSLPTNGEVVDFQIIADGNRVVWCADGDNEGVFELYSRATNGGGSQVKLNNSLPVGGNVLSGLQISADGSRAVWRADGDTNEVIELYSREADGSGSEVKINDSLPSYGDVDDFQISADSTRVVWRADGDNDGVKELFSRAIDGSGSQIKLNEPLTPGGNVVSNLLISADGSQVLYLADQDMDNVIEIYSVDGDKPRITAYGFVDADTFYIEFMPGGSGYKVVESTTLDFANGTDTATNTQSDNPNRFEFDVTGTKNFFIIEPTD